MRTLSENVLADTITALGMMICFYYSLTAFACVWYFRDSLFDSLRHFIMRGLCPLVGGVILSVIFARTAIDSASPDFGSGSHVGGLGLVFVIAAIISVLGIGLMMLSHARAGVLPGGYPASAGYPAVAGIKRGALRPSRTRPLTRLVRSGLVSRRINLQPIICFSSAA
jgi:hypothetical protein